MFEAYSVAIRLKLIDSVSSGLIGMASQFAAFNRHVDKSKANLAALEAKLKSIKMLGMVGGIAAGVGFGGLSLFEAPIKAAREYELAFTKFKTLNLGDEVNKQANHFARSADIMGVSSKQLMTTMSEAVGVFGSYSEAQKYVPKIAALNAANSAIFHGKIGEIDEGSTRALAKFMDRRGLTKDEAGFNRGLDLAERLVTGSGGFIQFRDLDQFSLHGGTAFRGLSDQGLTNMALLLQEQGGAGAATAMMSIYQNLVAGRTPVKTMHLLEDFGLGKIQQHTSGSVGGRSSTSNSFELSPAYAALIQANPTEFFRSVFLPKLIEHGISGEAGILKATNDLLSNRKASNQASIMTTQLLQIARDSNLTKTAMGDAQVVGAFKNDPNSKSADLTAKYFNLLLELGEVALPLATKAVGGLISIIQGMTNFAREFPTLTKGIVIFSGVLLGLVAVGGVVMMATAGFKALGLAMVIGKGMSLGAMLLEAATGMGALGIALGGIGLAAASIFAVYEAVKYLNEKDKEKHPGQHWVSDGGFNGKGGTGRKGHWAYDNDAKVDWDAPSFFKNPLDKDGGSPFVASGKSQNQQPITVTMMLDNRRVGEAFIGPMARSLMTPIGGANFDGTLSMAPVVLNQAH